MLVLSRKVGERILIGDGITITVVRIGQGGVRIGIEAPKELPVVREELSKAAVSKVSTQIADSAHGTSDVLVQSSKQPESSAKQQSFNSSDEQGPETRPRILPR